MTERSGEDREAVHSSRPPAAASPCDETRVSVVATTSDPRLPQDERGKSWPPTTQPAEQLRETHCGRSQSSPRPARPDGLRWRRKTRLERRACTCQEPARREATAPRRGWRREREAPPPRQSGGQEIGASCAPAPRELRHRASSAIRPWRPSRRGGPSGEGGAGRHLLQGAKGSESLPRRADGKPTDRGDRITVWLAAVNP